MHFSEHQTTLRAAYFGTNLMDFFDCRVAHSAKTTEAISRDCGREVKRRGSRPDDFAETLNKIRPLTWLLILIG